MMIRIGMTMAALALVASCEKAGPNASGELTETESELLAYLPKDADFAFGGNFMRLQKVFARGPLGRMLNQYEEYSPGLSKWTECFVSHESLRMLGSVDAGAGMEMRFVMKGITVSELERCASSAGFEPKLDADRKFIAIEMEGLVPQTLGFLVLSDGAIYSKQNLMAAFGGQQEMFRRTALEADIAAAQKSNALGNKPLQDLIERADRSRSLWIAGSAASTPYGDQVGEVFGSFDVTAGMRIDFTVEVKDGKFADELVDGLAEAKQAAGMLGPELKGILEDVALTRSGDRVRLVVKLSESQLDALFAFSSRMGGMR